MTTPERVAELLREDDNLTDEQRYALAELFRVAYEQLVTFGIDNDGSVSVDS
jgi:hypothetical protein